MTQLKKDIAKTWVRKANYTDEETEITLEHMRELWRDWTSTGDVNADLNGASKEHPLSSGAEYGHATYYPKE